MSSTGVNNIDVRDLAYELDTAYGDLSYVLARLVAIRHRMNPRDSLPQQLANALYFVNGEADNIIKRAEAMLAEPARLPPPPRPR